MVVPRKVEIVVDGEPIWSGWAESIELARDIMESGFDVYLRHFPSQDIRITITQPAQPEKVTCDGKSVYVD